MAQEGRRLSKQLDGALGMLKEQIVAAADAERDYRKAKAESWVVAPEGTAQARQAWVEGETADLRHRRDIAEGMVRACHQAIRSRQQQISLLQSVASAHKAEAEFARTGPMEAA
jgi:hypothetical protein